MKKTFNINVAGFPFTIDDDAYTLLSDYLDTIEHAFARVDDSRELINDIESRVAELLLEHTAEGSPIVTAADVEDVIHRIGQPEEMIEEDDSISIDPATGHATASEEIHETITPPPYTPPAATVKKKLYRNPQNAMLGGVCSGLACYFNADPTVVRLITVLITILSVATVSIAYLILWLVIPEAHTPLERMQMLGEEPTMENIGKTVTDNFREDNSTSSTSRSAGLGNTIAGFFSILVKVAIIIGLIIGLPLLIALVIGLVGCIFTLISFGTSWGSGLFDGIMPGWFEEAGTIPVYGLLIGVGGAIVLGIPLYLLVRKGLNKNAAPLSQGVRNTMLVTWIIGFILAAICTGRVINEVDNVRHIESQRWEERHGFHDDYDDWDFNDDEYISDEQSDFTISADSASATNMPTVIIDGDTIKTPMPQDSIVKTQSKSKSPSQKKSRKS